jgi:hypothetical protein
MKEFPDNYTCLPSESLRNLIFMKDKYLLPSFMVSHSGPVIEPPFKTKSKVDTEVLQAINPEVLEDSYIYVHCYFNNTWKDMLIRIWNTTYLVDHDSSGKSKLIHAENISYAPMWTLIPDGVTYTFLLVFSTLPKSCKKFDLIEELGQPGGFYIRNIKRNMQDVYHVNIME